MPLIDEAWHNEERMHIHDGLEVEKHGHLDDGEEQKCRKLPTDDSDQVNSSTWSK